MDSLCQCRFGAGTAKCEKIIFVSCQLSVVSGHDNFFNWEGLLAINLVKQRMRHNQGGSMGGSMGTQHFFGG